MIPTLLQDPQPWFSPDTANAMGAYGGASIGVLGAILGTCGGILVPRGKGRAVILPLLAVFATLGLGLLVTGLVALLQGQAWTIAYPFLLLGFILAVVFGSAVPTLRKLYQVAEQRRLDADALRRS